MKDLGAAFAAFLVTVIALAALRPVAVVVDLVDRPGGRKTHHGVVPVIGGVAMFIGLVVGFGLLEGFESMGPLLAAFGLLVAIGLLDDRFEVSPWTRLPVHAVAALVMILGSHTAITSLGDPFGLGEIHLHGTASIVLTVLVIMATINAFNMLDGMDGLAGSTALICSIALALIGARNGMPHGPRVAHAVIAVTGAFLLFNAPLNFNRRLRCFMGDAGSTVLGAVLAWLCLRASQATSHAVVSPLTVMWVVALPMYELIWSFARRLARGRSPLAADAGHFHHLLVRGGFSVRAAFLAFAALVSALSAIGLLLERVDAPDGVSLLCLALAGAVVVRSMYAASWLAKFLPAKLRRVDARQGRLPEHEAAVRPPPAAGAESDSSRGIAA